MAQLPPDGEWLIQQIGGEVVLFNRFTEQEIVRFNPADVHEVQTALEDAFLEDVLTLEQKCFVAFWSGYFYAHSMIGAAE